MRRLFVILLSVFVVGIGQNLMAECYLSIENPGEFEPAAITQISTVQISQHFEPVSEIPPQGVATDACVYTLSVSELSNGILVSIKGRKASTFGNSKLRGFDGFQQALFRAIISAKPEQKGPICQRYSNLMGSDCSGATTPPSIGTKGRLVVRVPDDFRYSRILSSGVPIGEMDGQKVREFSVETGVTLTLTAVDGDYRSEKIYVTTQPGATTKIRFMGFKTDENQGIINRPVQPPSPAPAPEPESQPPIEREREARSKVDFGEHGALILGASFGSHLFSSDEDEFRKESQGAEAITKGLSTDFFIQFFFNQNVGIGYKVKGVSAERKDSSGKDKQKLSISNILFTLALWFPLSTKGKGYSHFGLEGGAGSSTYKVENEEDGSVESEWEAKGTCVLYGAFLDWGGELFGGRLGYNRISTSFDKLKEKDGNSTSELEVDGSGSGMYLSLRWAL